MVILGIDPGIATTGYGFIHKQGSRLTVLDFGVITTPAGLELSYRLKLLSESLELLMKQYRPECAAVEELFFSTNVKTALMVGQARGVILLALETFGLSVCSYTPLQVKSGVCGYGKAEKKQVQYMVKKLLGLVQLPKPDDAADALALAICHSHALKLQSRV